MFDGEIFAQEVVGATKAHVDKAVAPLLARMGELEKQIEGHKAWTQTDIQRVSDTVAEVWQAIPKPQEPQEFDPELVRVIAQEVIDARLVAFPVPENGKDGVGLPGKDGEPGLPGKDAVLPDLSILEYAPDEVATSIALAIKKMAEFSGTRIVEVAEKSIPVPLPTFNFTLADNRAPPVVNIEAQPAPVVNMAAPVVTVSAPQIHVDIPKRGKEVTTVTGWDKAGRVTSFEKTEVDD